MEMHGKNRSTFIINQIITNGNPVLQADRMETWHESGGVSVSKVTNGVLTNGRVMLPVNGTVKRYRDGRIEVNGEPIDWASVVARSTTAPTMELPEAIDNEAPAQEGESPCIICGERAVKTAINKCGHQVYCVTCARATVTVGTTCPMCRKPITSVIRVYQTQ